MKKRRGHRPLGKLKSNATFDFQLSTVNFLPSLIRRFHRPAHVQVAQIPQRRPIFLAHPARKIRIVQPLVPRILRHILQHTQSLPDRLLAIRRHLSPTRQHIRPDVLALLRCHPVPHLRAIPQHLLLSRRQTPQTLLVLQHSLPLLRSHVPPALLHIRRCRRASRSILISVVVRNILRIARVRRTIVPRVVMPSVPGRCRMRRRRRWLRRTVLRRRSRQRHRHGQPEPTPPSTEFAPAFHNKKFATPTSECSYPASSLLRRHSAPAAANHSTHRSSTARRNSPALANHQPPALLDPHPHSAPSLNHSAAIPAKPSPTPASTPQTPPAATAQTPPTKRASPAPRRPAPAPARQTRPKARSAAIHPASPSTREIHSHAEDTPRKSSDASPLRASRSLSSAHPRKAESGFPFDCNS